MTDHLIQCRSYPALPLSRREILRYMGVAKETKELSELLDGALEEATAVLRPMAVYTSYPIAAEGERLELGFGTVQSRDLARALNGCRSILLLAATVGIGLDRLIARDGRLSPARALCLQAIGTEAVEVLLDTLCREIDESLRSKDAFLLPRFSPGYGDLPLSLQREIFAALDCPRRIGLTLGRELLMSPTKSVTAIVGVGDVDTQGKDILQ